MTIKKMFTTLAAIASLTALADSHTALADTLSDTAATCAACHKNGSSFEGQDRDFLAARIRAILKGEIPHPPLRLADTSDEDIARIAAMLAGDS